jgi:hypothetical protein
MLKYGLLAIAILGIALFYAYVTDPCNKLVRTDFASRHPDYRILDSDAAEGAPESVRCRIAYQKPDSDRIHEEVWVYQHEKKKTGWEFSRVLGTRTRDEKP